VQISNKKTKLNQLIDIYVLRELNSFG